MELISREMAIDHIRVLGGEDRERLMGILNNKIILPTIENRTKGKWEDATMNFANNKYINAIFGQGYLCSNCGTYMPNTKTNFCAECGADMREIEEDTEK